MLRMRFKIEYRLSVSENAQRYYERSKKARRKVEGARGALEKTRQKIMKLEKDQELVDIPAKMPRKKKVKKKIWYDKFRHFHSSDNMLIVGGKDATTNEILIKKYLEERDMVFHADIQGAPFFIIKNPKGNKIPKETIEEVAEAAASYSKAWKAGRGNCDVYYVRPDQVSKDAPAGEYLPKGAFMIHGKRSWLRNTPLRMGIGFRINDEATVIGGPVNAVSKNSDYFLEIGVGDKKSKELAKEIKKVISGRAKKEHREIIKRIDVEEIQVWIPGGKAKLTK